MIGLPHRLELVRVLTEGLSIFSEVNLNVGNVANLVLRENAEDALLPNGFYFASFESEHVNILGVCFVA